MLIENYDANGNMVKRGGSTISYSSYNLPTLINSGSNSSAISYGAYRNRYKQVAQSAEGTETTIYVAGLVEKVTRGGLVEYRHLIAGGQRVAAIHTRRSGGTPASDTVYVHTDHLGSPELFTNSSGGVAVRPSFGAYGERRDGSDWDGPVSAADLDKIADTIRHGFTGHEHLDAVGLIHMNGRVYDPLAGRFLGVDPIVHVGNGQSPNGYSYVWNNPLTFVDPSGFDHCDVTDINCHRNDPPVNPFEPEPPFWDPRPDEPSERRFPSMAHAYIANSDAIFLPRDYRAELGQVMPTVDGTVGGLLPNVDSLTNAVANWWNTEEIVENTYLQYRFGYPRQTVTVTNGETVIAVVTLASALAGPEALMARLGGRWIAARGATTVAERALAARARYPKQVEQAMNMTPQQLRSSIQSFTENIAKHQGFLKNPQAHVPNWNQLSPQHQQSLIHHWRTDIARAEAYRDIAEAILGGTLK